MSPFATWWRVAAPTLILFVALNAPAAAQQAISLPKELAVVEGRVTVRSGPAIVIPSKPGPQADERLVALARQIEAADQEIRASEAKERLSQEQLGAIVQARNLAVLELLAGRELLLGTAAGVFPRRLQTSITGLLDAVTSGLAEPKGRNLVEVTVRYTGPSKSAVAVEYQTYAAAADKSDQWATHSPAQPLALGTYWFRVVDIVKRVSCRERIPVLSQPTTQGICASFNP